MAKKPREALFGRCLILKQWDDWEYVLHEDDPQVRRQGTAMNYPFTFQIDTEGKCGHFSSTIISEGYQTTLSSCDCDDFLERLLPCKHIYRLAVELGYIEIINRQGGGGFDADALNELKESQDIDNEPDQIKRQQSAMTEKCKPASIDYEDKTATFAGSGKVPYITTVDTCTCRDYFVRRLPCKHIYRLRYELSNQP